MRLEYSLHGDRASPRRIALVHSLAMDRAFWDPVIERLAGQAAILAYDCRGHGASDKPAGPYTLDAFADDLSQLLDRAGWARAAVAGASMGGCVALAFAARHPKRTAALGLVDTTAWYGPQAPAQWEERAGKALRSGLQGLVDFQTTRWFGDAFRARNPAVVARCVEVFLRNDVQAYAATCRMLGAMDLRAALSAIRVPTAVVVGEEDYATPVAMAQELHQSIPGSTLTVLKDARHLTPLEQPDQVAAELDKLIRRTGVQVER